MYLLQSWKESLLIFKPTNFKLFFLVTVKSIWETYKILFRYFWWLILVLLFAPDYSFNLSIIKLLLLVLFAYFVILTVRSSVNLKNGTYFVKYIFSYYMVPIVSLIVFLFMFFFFQVALQLGAGCFHFLCLIKIMPIKALLMILAFVIPIGISETSFGLNSLIYNTLYQVLISPLIILFSLFYLDSDKGLKSLWVSLIRSIKMVIYNYPVYFIMYYMGILLVLHIVWRIIFFLGAENLMAAYIYNSTTVIFFMPLAYVIVSNLYIKQVHEQFSLYFGGKLSEK